MRRRKRAPRAASASSAGQPQGASETSQRRVRLKLYRDPETGADRVSLAAPLFEDDWQNGLAEAAANTGLEMLGGSRELTPIASFGEKMTQALSRYLSGLLASAEARLACRPGCDHCCHQIVGATMPEVLSIWHFVGGLPHPIHSALKEKFIRAAERAAGLSPAERFSPDHPCPFLEGGVCAAYAVRPLACRGVHALDADICREILRSNAARARFLETGEGSPSFREPGRAVQSLSAGMQLCLSEVYDLDMHPIDLTLGMAHLFRDPTWAGRWVQGERVPSELKAGHGSLDARRRAITGERRAGGEGAA